MDLRDIINAMKADDKVKIVLGPDGWVCGVEPIDMMQQGWLIENKFIDSIGFVNGYQTFVLTEFGRTVDFVTYMTS